MGRGTYGMFVPCPCLAHGLKTLSQRSPLMGYVVPTCLIVAAYAYTNTIGCMAH